jgi:hypothetical protein
MVISYGDGRNRLLLVGRCPWGGRGGERVAWRIWRDDEKDSWSETLRSDELGKANDDEGSEHLGRADANEIGNDVAQANGSDWRTRPEMPVGRSSSPTREPRAMTQRRR